MEFLVRAENRLCPGGRERAAQLREAGILKRLWRAPSRNATVGLYEADGPAALHDALTSLPMWKWMDVTVEALAAPPAAGAHAQDLR